MTRHSPALPTHVVHSRKQSRRLRLDRLEDRRTPAFLGYWTPKQLAGDGPPIAVDDQVTFRESVTVEVGVLANDQAEAGIDPTSVKVVAEPQIGRVSTDPTTGQIVYYPRLGQTESDEFAYTFADRYGRRSNSATVKVVYDTSGGEYGPLPRAAVSTTLENPVTVSLLGDLPPTAIVPGSIALVSPPLNGSFVMNQSTGQLTYTPNFGFTGVETLTATATFVSPGITGTIMEVTIEVMPVAPQVRPDPAGGQMLVVYGTRGDDRIQLTPADGNRVTVRLSGESAGTFGPVDRVFVFAGGGDDQVTIGGGVSTPAWVYGEGGADVLQGGSGGGILVGGTGNDQLRA
ncbi:MAG TPA: Ig-like domain-containing protein, partial [Gemmataceae bacterium]|nr:Ig-like domain-containing protein [Gemmataceae bacterium]